MPRNKPGISKSSSYQEIGEFWDTHDLGDYWDKTRPVEFEIDIRSEETYYPVDAALSKKFVRLQNDAACRPKRSSIYGFKSRCKEKKHNETVRQ